MYYTGLSKLEKRLVLLTEEEKFSAFNEAHVLNSGDHCGEYKGKIEVNVHETLYTILNI